MITAIDSPHFKAFRKLKPIECDAEDAAVALELDRVMEEYDDIAKEMSPSTCTSTLSRWEEVYGLSGEGDLDTRRQRLLAAYNADSGIAAHHYETMALALGFRVSIKPPKRLFRAGVSRLGDKCYNLEEQYTWTVVCNYMESEIIPLIEAFERNKIPFTEVKWELKKLAAFELESGKFLELDDGKIFMLEQPAEDYVALELDDGNFFELENGRLLMLEEIKHE